MFEKYFRKIGRFSSKFQKFWPFLPKILIFGFLPKTYSHFKLLRVSIESIYPLYIGLRPIYNKYEVQARAPKGAHLVKCFFKWFFQNNVFSQISPRIQSFLRSIVFHNLKNLTFSVWRIALVQKSHLFLKSEFFSFFSKAKIVFCSR